MTGPRASGWVAARANPVVIVAAGAGAVDLGQADGRSRGLPELHAAVLELRLRARKCVDRTGRESLAGGSRIAGDDLERLATALQRPHRRTHQQVGRGILVDQAAVGQPTKRAPQGLLRALLRVAMLA